MKFFSEQKDILKLGTIYLKYTSLSVVGLAIAPIITGAFQGAGQIKKVMYLNMFRLWGLRLPLLFVLPYFIGKSETVIWSAMTSSNLITMFICLYFYKRSNFQPVKKTLLVKC